MHLAKRAQVGTAAQAEVVAVSIARADAAGAMHVRDARGAAVAQVAEVPRVLPLHLIIRQLVGPGHSLHLKPAAALIRMHI